MNYGTIQVNVYTSRAKIPVSDATTILKRNKQLLAVEITNKSGQTRPISVPTSELEESETPMGESPFTAVDVYVEHPEFISQIIENVQIFPETTSILPVTLEPLGENQSSLAEYIQIDLPEQNL